jgi:hypothetical protein
MKAAGVTGRGFQRTRKRAASWLNLSRPQRIRGLKETAMWNCAKNWAEIAPGLTPIVALIGLGLAVWQLWLIRTNQRETTAKGTFREFLKLCVQLPDLAYGKPSSGKQTEYEWFVAYFLWATEEILEYSPKGWEENLRLHMTYHKDYLKTNKRFRDEDFRTYSAAVQNLIKKVVGSFSST